MADEIPSFPTLQPPPSLKDMAFQTIKEHVFTHGLKPGCVYSEQALAREFQLSKTPIHQALTDLETRGFLTILPRRGFRVNSLTKKEVQDLFAFRHVLERTVILMVIPELTENAVNALESLNNQAAKTRDRFRFLKYDRGFHLHLASLTGNRFLADALENIKDLCDWVGAEVFSLNGRPEEAMKEHNAVVEMLKKGDAPAAAEAMAAHLLITEKCFFSKAPEERSDK
jgi:DNA-binding GntR family transcriptional regulator